MKKCINARARRGVAVTPTTRMAMAAAMIVAVTIVVAAPRIAHAQATRRASTTVAHDCGPRPASHGATFAWGNVGGTLKRRANRLWADGSMQLADGVRTPPNGALADSARVLAAEARRSPFWTTVAPPITRPTRNPDMAREYIEVHLRCGSHRALYPADAEPATFAALVRRLNAIIGVATTH